MKFAIIGSGAVGGYFGARLHEAGHTVYFLARGSHLEALTVLFNEHSISNVLNLTVDQAIDLFSNIPKIVNKLTVMKEVGLGYIKLGQPATTLSGGEAQRVKLATELSNCRRNITGCRLPD